MLKRFHYRQLSLSKVHQGGSGSSGNLVAQHSGWGRLLGGWKQRNGGFQRFQPPSKAGRFCFKVSAIGVWASISLGEMTGVRFDAGQVDCLKDQVSEKSCFTSG